MEFWPVLSCNMISGSLDTLGKQHKRTDQVCYSTVLCSEPSNSRIIGPNLAPHEGFAVVFKGCRIRPFVCKVKTAQVLPPSHPMLKIQVRMGNCLSASLRHGWWRK
ncbi:hypothetical protein KIL84_019039 [Mauremys mutica]|uniref:Uncharacterized protein n=1 Tax=Mauremys mutica TaxID=74926 RepID=A0A9D3XW07_9SAUR|nr:hypothetical protein KIL84_019039 [Mauremys mutica]